MNLKKIFWPWGVIGELERELAFDDRHIHALLEEKVQMWEDVLAYEETLALMEEVDNRDLLVLGDALMTIIETVQSANAPNGTSKKLMRIAQNAIDNMHALILDEDRIQIRQLLEEEEKAARESPDTCEPEVSEAA